MKIRFMLPERRKTAFTLIELLVVIAIIALLLAIIIPALKKAKEVAHEMICKTNIKSYGLCGTLYLEDNDQQFPFPWWIIYNNYNSLPTPGCAWHNDQLNPDDQPGMLWPYLENKKVNVCPVFASLAPTRAKNHDGGALCNNIPIKAQFSYSMNSYLGGAQRNAINAGPQYIGDVEKLSDIERTPSQVAYFGEESLWDISLRDGTLISSGAFNDNVLLIRGSVPGENEDPWPYADCLASFHKTNDPDRKFGKSHVVFVDGHVELVEPKNSFHACWVKRGNWLVDQDW